MALFSFVVVVVVVARSKLFSISKVERRKNDKEFAIWLFSVARGALPHWSKAISPVTIAHIAIRDVTETNSLNSITGKVLTKKRLWHYYDIEERRALWNAWSMCNYKFPFKITHANGCTTHDLSIHKTLLAAITTSNPPTSCVSLFHFPNGRMYLMSIAPGISYCVSELDKFISFMLVIH